MLLRFRRLATRFAALMAAAAVVPLVVYGAMSIVSVQRGTRDSIVAGNLNVATRAAEEIRRYVATNAELLKALAAELQDTGLTLNQQDLVLKNYVGQFPEYKEVTLFDEREAPRVSSRTGATHVQLLRDPVVTFGGVSMSAIRIDQDGLPTATFAVPLTQLNRPAGWLVGELNLEQLWKMVDQIRIGAHGYAMVVAPHGELVAHGDPDKKALVAQARNISGNALVQAARAASGGAPLSREYRDEDGVEQLGVAAPVADLHWTMLVEQPTKEAFATATALRNQLVIAISLALLVMVTFGYFFGRSFIRPILTLKQGTQAVASGNLEARVDIRSGDEFADLGEAFNTMANRLVELQEDVKRQERQAMFGRVAAGLVHDLLHPIQNVGNNAKLLMRPDADAEVRDESGRIIERELGTIKRFLDDLHNLVRPRPLERFAMDINASVAEIVEAMRSEGERHGITVSAAYSDERLIIDGDRFALGRVFRNLITNAIQATQPGGSVTIATAREGDRVAVTVADTGSGIPPERLAAIFEDFVTTKRRGLGLGLAVSKRIVEQLNGTIAVESAVGRGTAFTLRFPAQDDRAVAAAAS